MSIILPNEATLPSDLVNLGLKCRVCQSKRVVYQITLINDRFPVGPYCYPCLLNACRATKRRPLFKRQDQYAIPQPMPWNLFARLKVDLGLETAKLNPMF